MMYDKKGGKGFDLDVILREHAEDARERLLEIHAEGFLKMDGGSHVCLSPSTRREIEGGDKLMIP